MTYDKLCNTNKDFLSLWDITDNSSNTDKEITDNITHLTDNLNKLNLLVTDI